MTQQVIFAGFGGQGVMSLGELLTYAGMHAGHEVSWLPSYGPEMRGGAASCMVIVSDEPVAAPIITEADAVIAMNLPSLDKFESLVAKGGHLLINSSLIDRKVERDDMKVHYIPANDEAMALGNDRVAGMVMLGAYLELTGCVSIEDICEVFTKVFGEKRIGLLPLNKAAMERGAALMKA